MQLFNFSSKNYFILMSGASPNTSTYLPQERIEALISAEVFHVNANEARDVDCICTPLAMECLSGYALKPSFIDPIFSTAVKMASEEINCPWRILSNNKEIV